MLGLGSDRPRNMHFPTPRFGITDAVWLLVLVAVGLSISYFRSRHSDLATALFGFTPNILFDPVWTNAPGFDADFPNGEENMLRSLGGQLYRLLGLMPWPENVLHGIAIFLEFAALCIGTIICARAVSPGLPVWFAFVAALFLAASTLFDSDLARWGHPFYGAVYNFANGAGLAAMGLIIGRKPVTAGLVLAVGGMVHPTIAILFAVPCAIVGLAGIRSFTTRQIAVAIVLPAAIFGSWIIYAYSGSGGGVGAIDAEMFIALSKMMSSHWFPIDLGVFTTRSWEDFIPFMAVITVFFALLGPIAGRVFPHDGLLAVCMLALLAVTSIGVLVSTIVESPLLIKLALHRSSAVALLLAGVAVIPRLLLVARDGPVLPAIAAAGLLMLPFWEGKGWPIIWAVVFAITAIVARRHDVGRTFGLFGIAAVLAALVVIGLLAAYGHTQLFAEANTHLAGLRDPRLLALIAAVFAIVRFTREPFVVALAFLWLAFGQADRFDYFQSEDLIEKAADFRDVQNFARENTAPGTVFMMEPTHAYGWRSYSRRPSFGTLREWLYTSWAYDSRPELLNDGIARSAALGLEIGHYIEGEEGQGSRSLRADASESYNNVDLEMIRSIHAEFDVDYFVFEKEKLCSGCIERFDYETVFFGVVSVNRLLQR